mgnify:CR=1 FL=1
MNLIVIKLLCKIKKTLITHVIIGKLAVSFIAETQILIFNVFFNFTKIPNSYKRR